MPHTTGDVGAGGAAGVAVVLVEGDEAVVKIFQFLKAEERNLNNVGEGGEGVIGEPGTSATWTRTPRSGSRWRRPRPGRPPCRRVWPRRSARITAASRLRRSGSSSWRLEDQMKSILDKAATSSKRLLKELPAESSSEAFSQVARFHNTAQVRAFESKFVCNEFIKSRLMFAMHTVQTMQTLHCLHRFPCQDPEMRNDVISPLTDCEQLSLEQYMRGQSAVDNHRAPRPAPRQPRMLPSFEETRQSLKESVRMKTFQTSLNMFPSLHPD